MNSSNGNHNGSGNGHDPDEKRTDNIIRMPTLAERDKLRREQEKQWQKEYRAANKTETMINLPPVTKYMVGLLVLIHLLVHYALSEPTQYRIMEMFGFVPAYYTVEFPGWPALLGPFTYALLHASWLHIGMNLVMLCAFGAGIEKWMGGKKMLLLFIASSLGAALCHLVLSPHSAHLVIGASGGVSGMFAAVMIMLQRQGTMGAGKYGLLPFIAIWIVISIIFGLLGSPDGSPIAWAAHIGGFLTGFLVIKPILRMKV